MAVVEIVNAVFCNLDATELSNINHMQKAWKIALENSTSKTGSFHLKEDSVISINDLLRYDIQHFKNLVYAYEITKKERDRLFSIKIDDKVFYYDPKKINMDQTLEERLKGFCGDEEAYTICIDKSGEMVIY